MSLSGQPTDAVRLARAYLSHATESGRVAVVALVDEVGPVEAANRVRSGDAALTDITSDTRSYPEGLVRRQLENFMAAGGRLVIPEDEEWPVGPLMALSGTEAGVAHGGGPLALWVCGSYRLADVLGNAVAVVGSRAATGYGEHVASEFGYGLAEQGVTVISGAAYGIDGAAHRGAMQAQGVTLAVLACGADVAYPAGHQGLLSRIAREGMIVSEYPPGQVPARHRFLARNRIIAALSAGTVVVEAGRRSGAKHTAKVAVALERSLMAVPGPITSVTSLGCHELMRRRIATPVSSVAEILESVPQLDASDARHA
ncbi:DNA-processing protein DprA [Lentzea flaviverrucosa]|uniref:DNA processing protein n=1 Tax=Lentzea flaviverrucosa TaxID=200379 RepID=A0A1H9XYL0_9PSEU|nr:DNA-processing protein DprA [Lentzea flaviverrucosa]RDI16387.1 DNA processing protein [Lentzea flaviverrucosa]SES51206.1 DNA processing protein [Lentzea flaviverrucosa]